MTSSEDLELEQHDPGLDALASASILNILIAVDAEGIIDKYGKNNDPDAPTQLLYEDVTDYLIMVTRKGNTSGQWGPMLNINAKIDDTIRWRETSMALNSDYFALLYEYQHYGGDEGIISTPQPLVTQPNVALPNMKNPRTPHVQKIHDFFWTATALNEGTENYYFKFMLLDNKATPQGYYYWDPTITISAD